MGDLTAPLLAGLFGLVVGSFLNVCIYRLPRGISIVSPPSRCPSCGRRLRWFDNIPVVSWMVLRGRCGRCGSGISVQYPIVELATAALFVLVTLSTPPGSLLAARLVLGCALIVLFAIDLEHQILPNVITLPGIAVGFAFALLAPTGDPSAAAALGAPLGNPSAAAALGAPPGWRSSLLGAIVGGGSLYAMATAYYWVRREEGLGMGDVKMLAMIGAFLGWPAVLLTLVLASFAGSLIGVAMIALGHGTMKYALPFGTFLAVGALVAMLVGDRIIRWYVGFY